VVIAVCGKRILLGPVINTVGGRLREEEGGREGGKKREKESQKQSLIERENT